MYYPGPGFSQSISLRSRELELRIALVNEMDGIAVLKVFFDIALLASIVLYIASGDAEPR